MAADPDSSEVRIAMFQLLLFLHVLGAIAAFGFGFVAPIFGSMLAKEPQHANWYVRSGKRATDVVLLPAALSMAVTGIGLVATTERRLEEPWLAIAIVIYIAALLAVFLIQRPAFSRLIELTSPPPGPDGPPAEAGVLSASLRMVGFGLTTAVVIIVLLMVWKPGS